MINKPIIGIFELHSVGRAANPAINSPIPSVSLTTLERSDNPESDNPDTHR